MHYPASIGLRQIRYDDAGLPFVPSDFGGWVERQRLWHFAGYGYDAEYEYKNGRHRRLLRASIFALIKNEASVPAWLFQCTKIFSRLKVT